MLPVAAAPWESRNQPLQEGAIAEKRKKAGDTSVTSFLPTGDGQS